MSAIPTFAPKAPTIPSIRYNVGQTFCSAYKASGLSPIASQRTAPLALVPAPAADVNPAAPAPVFPATTQVVHSMWQKAKSTVASLIPWQLRTDIAAGAALGFGGSVAEVGTQFTQSFVSHPVSFAATGIVLGGTILGWNKSGLGKRLEAAVQNIVPGVAGLVLSEFVPRNLGLPIMTGFVAGSLITGDYAHLVTGGTVILGVQALEKHADRQDLALQAANVSEAVRLRERARIDQLKSIATTACILDDVGPAFMTAQQHGVFSSIAQLFG